MKILKWNSTYLQQRMPSNDTQKPLQAFPPSFDDLVREPVGEYLAREGSRWDVDASGFALAHIPEGFEV
jgi:hypothetical protein